MRPALRDVKGLAKQMRPAVFVGAAQEDHIAFELSVQIEAEVRRHGATLRRPFSPGAAARTMRGDVACARRFKLSNVFERPALPNLRLPQAVKAFDCVLKSRLARRCKYRDHTQRQAQAAHPTDSASKLMRALELCSVVELGISGQPLELPALKHALEHELGGSLLKGPGIDQTAMQRSAIEHPDQGAVGDLQFVDQIK